MAGARTGKEKASEMARGRAVIREAATRETCPVGGWPRTSKKQGDLILTVKLFAGFTANPHPAPDLD